MDDTLELKIQSTLKQVLPQFKELTKSITNTDVTLNNLFITLDKKGNLKEFTFDLKQMGNEGEKAGNKIKKALTFTGVMVGFKKTFDFLYKNFEESVDYAESLNLFNVVLGDKSSEGMKFQNRLNEIFGANQTLTLQYQGYFHSMAQNMGIASDQAYILSENLTKLGFDIASLYNISDESAMQKLRAGLAGQTKPLRDIGLDITQQSLQPILDRLNLINADGTMKTVRQLSQAEKMIVRYIAILEQSASAHGDFANTIEAPANQLKIFNMQVKETSRAIGTLFIGVISSILPYINGFLMAIKEVMKSIAFFLGIKASDFNSSIGSLSEAFIDVEDSISTTTDSAKKLKNILFGFDEIHNISFGNDSVAVGGFSDLANIDQELINAMKDYDNLMERIQTKASGIRDGILSWLGITRNINEETGEVSYGFELSLKSIVGLGVAGLVTTGVLGKVIGGVGVVLKKVGLLKGATTGVGTAVATTTGKVTLFSKLIGGLKIAGAFAMAHPVISLTTLALSALVYQGLKPSIKEVDLFGKGISEVTKEKLKPFIDDVDELSKTVKKIELGSVVSENDVNSIKTSVSKITETLKNDYLKDIEELEKKLNDKTLYPDLTDEQRKKMLNQVKEANKERIADIENAEKRINEIYENAHKENRNLYESEKEEIRKLQKYFTDEGIKTLTQNEEEQRLIYTRMKENAKNLTVQQYSEILQEAKKNKENMIKEAQEKYDEEIKLANTLFYDLKVIDETEYKAMLDRAKTNYDKAVKEADESFNKIKLSAKENMGEMSKHIDLETGEIKNNLSVWWDDIKKGWDTFWENWDTGWKKIKKGAKSGWDSFWENWNTGINIIFGGGKYADGGFPTTGQMFIAREAGPELVGTIGGRTAVANNDQIIEGIKQGVYEAVSQANRSNKSSTTLKGTINGKELIQITIDGINGITNQTGEFPLDLRWA